MTFFCETQKQIIFTKLYVPVSAATILMNMFFIYCMFSSQDGSEICQKPPLNVLFGSLIGCNLLLNICNLLFVMYDFVDVPIRMYIISSALIMYAMRTSVTASLGVNVFYYFQIVPARHPCLIWLKTHIKLFMYLMLFFDRFFFLFSFFLHAIPSRVFISVVYFNSSSIPNYNTDGLIVRYNLLLTDFSLRCSYFWCCLGIMLASNTATAHYLWRHVKSMEGNSGSALRYRKQKRVTILSITQTVLFFFCSGWLMADELIYRFDLVLFDPSGHILCSVLVFYSFGTTIILGLGQSKFRLRAVDFVKKLVRLSYEVHESE
ncbi:taste receptor [Triplophysa rosa]|uniref:Taste receptor n=1 Tax=Triplophysa rosa TaxID=992332 RepID=A0A9W7WUE0_TRIRA|nr:taste receptor [Triplophysa rosa]